MTTEPSSTQTPNPETRAGQEEMKRLGIVPFPVADDISRPFWEAANRHELVIQRCSACSAFQHPPAATCMHCDSPDLQWTPVSGNGKVFTYIVDHRNEVPGFDGNYVFAFITPDETDDGLVRLTGNVLECDPNDVHIGMPVEVFYKEIKPGVTLPEFRPRRS
jgi:uncharacterized protein